MKYIASIGFIGALSACANVQNLIKEKNTAAPIQIEKTSVPDQIFEAELPENTPLLPLLHWTGTEIDKANIKLELQSSMLCAPGHSTFKPSGDLLKKEAFPISEKTAANIVNKSFEAKTIKKAQKNFNNKTGNPSIQLLPTQGGVVFEQKASKIADSRDEKTRSKFFSCSDKNNVGSEHSISMPYQAFLVDKNDFSGGIKFSVTQNGPSVKTHDRVGVIQAGSESDSPRFQFFIPEETGDGLALPKDIFDVLYKVNASAQLNADAFSKSWELSKLDTFITWKACSGLGMPVDVFKQKMDSEKLTEILNQPSLKDLSDSKVKLPCEQKEQIFRAGIENKNGLDQISKMLRKQYEKKACSESQFKLRWSAKKSVGILLENAAICGKKQLETNLKRDKISISALMKSTLERKDLEESNLILKNLAEHIPQSDIALLTDRMVALVLEGTETEPEKDLERVKMGLLAIKTAGEQFDQDRTKKAMQKLGVRAGKAIVSLQKKRPDSAISTAKKYSKLFGESWLDALKKTFLKNTEATIADQKSKAATKLLLNLHRSHPDIFTEKWKNKVLKKIKNRKAPKD